MRFSDRRPQGAIRLPSCPDGLRTAQGLRPRRLRNNSYMARTSSGAVADKLISENTTGHMLQTAVDSTLSEQAALSSGPVSVGQGSRPSSAPLAKPLRYLRPGQRPRPSFRNSSRGLLAPQFWKPAFSFVVHIVYLKRLQGRDADSIGQSKVSEFYQRTPTGGGADYGHAPPGCHKPPPAQMAYGLPTLWDLNSYEIRGQHVIRADMDKLTSENTTRHVLLAAANRIRSERTAPPFGTASVSRARGNQTPPLTGSVEIPLTGPEATATGAVDRSLGIVFYFSDFLVSFWLHGL